MYLWGVLTVVFVECFLILCFLLPLPSRVKVVFSSVINNNKNIFYIIGSVLLMLLAGTTLELSKYEENYETAPHSSSSDFLQTEHMKLMKFRTERNFYLKSFAFTLLLVIFGLMHLTTSIAAIEAKYGVLQSARTPSPAAVKPATPVTAK
eukprot:TRINITY_DN2043_c0_g2_i1.p1 TRINITY_DN2043_c0_g2~~TRINITY_DN2043_c0_g2_i1.p1  ORF type:complete len:150 (-),score=33.92 TRINITY_DN2043_c0_g2_i1:130-579(-)